MFTFKTTLALLRIIQKNRKKSVMFSFRDFLDIVLLRAKYKAFCILLAPMKKSMLCNS